MKYTINDKEYSEFDINKRCAELMSIKIEYPMFNEIPYHRYKSKGVVHLASYDPCNNPQDTWPIIDKVWDELFELVDQDGYIAAIGDYPVTTRWEYLCKKHNCTKLVAACICFIECYGGEL